MGVMIMMIAGTLPSMARMLGMIGMLHMVMLFVFPVLIMLIALHILAPWSTPARYDIHNRPSLYFIREASCRLCEQ
jgi:hypothetical protein